MKVFRKHKKENKGIEGRSYRDFLLLFPLCCEDKQKEIKDYLEVLPAPTFINDKEICTNLNAITYGQLDDLSRINNGDPVVNVFDILLQMQKEDVYALKVGDVFGFCNMVTREVTRINKLFSSISLEHTPDEVAAGIDQLSFGSFGILDWYAKRMGITNQNEVRSVPWVRIYTCMKNDTAQVAYERRYNQVLTNKVKSRRR